MKTFGIQSMGRLGRRIESYYKTDYRMICDDYERMECERSIY